MRREALGWAAPALVVAGVALLVLLSGAGLGEVARGFLNGAFGGRGWSYLFTTLGRAGIILGMALSALVAFRAGLFNIGGEGQLVLGGLAAAAVGVAMPGPGWLVLPCGLLAGALAGAAWAALGAALALGPGVPLLVATLLLNYPARFLASWAVSFPLRDVASGLPQTFPVDQAAWLPMLPGTRLDAGILVVLAATAAVLVYCHLTTEGLRARLTGLAPSFARASGLPVARLTLRTMALSGALAGLVGGLVVFGQQHRFTDGMLVQPLYAWTGIVAVLLVGLAPALVPLSAFFFAALQTGAAGMERTADLPREIALVAQAAIILLVAARVRAPGSRPVAGSGPQDG